MLPIMPIEAGATYVLRSINYSYSDVLVAFKIVRQDIDGSLIIAWKLLNKFPKPACRKQQRIPGRSLILAAQVG